MTETQARMTLDRAWAEYERAWQDGDHVAIARTTEAYCLAWRAYVIADKG